MEDQLNRIAEAFEWMARSASRIADANERIAAAQEQHLASAAESHQEDIATARALRQAKEQEAKTWELRQQEIIEESAVRKQRNEALTAASRGYQEIAEKMGHITG
jgi:hypothetical protein